MRVGRPTDMWTGWRIRPWMAVVFALGLVLVGAAMALYNEDLAKADKLRAATVQAEILAGSVGAALSFDDVDLVQEYLNALRANGDVEAAGVYGLNGALVASYARSGAAPAPRSIRSAPVRDLEHMVVTRSVSQGATPLGFVYLRVSQERWLRSATRYAGIAILVVMAALLVGVLGASNATLVEAHRKLMVEMDERERTETALRLSREHEAAAQLELAVQRSRAALRQTERQLAYSLDAGRLGNWVVDLRTGVLTASEHFRANFGLGPEVDIRRLSSLDPFIHPDDLERLRAARRRPADGAEFEGEFRTVAPDGVVRWMFVRGQSIAGDDDGDDRMAGISLDITERKHAEERLRNLVDELNHRVKNTLATVQSIAIQTLRATASTLQFEPAFLARLGALGRVHELLSRIAWEGASLADVVRQTLAPHLTPNDPNRRLTLDGVHVLLGPNAAVTLAMAFHELATNAAKYGALSAPHGGVEVRWSVDNPIAPGRLDIKWREIGGPTVVQPSRKGFGSRFIERGVAREFDGVVNIRYAPDGLLCEMSIPLSQKLRLAA